VRVYIMSFLHSARYYRAVKDPTTNTNKHLK